jgi:hypothetical protein
MAIKMIHYSTSQKDYFNHNGHVQMDVSKMTKWPFLCLSILNSFLSIKLIHSTIKYNSERNVLFDEKDGSPHGPIGYGAKGWLGFTLD